MSRSRYISICLWENTDLYPQTSSHSYLYIGYVWSVPSLQTVSFSILMCQMFNHVQSQCSLSTCSIWQTRSVEDIIWLNPFGFKQCFNPWQNSIHLGLNHPQAGRISNTWLKYAEICMGQPFNVHNKHQTGQPNATGLFKVGKRDPFLSRGPATNAVRLI